MLDLLGTLDLHESKLVILLFKLTADSLDRNLYARDVAEPMLIVSALSALKYREKI